MIEEEEHVEAGPYPFQDSKQQIWRNIYRSLRTIRPIRSHPIPSKMGPTQISPYPTPTLRSLPLIITSGSLSCLCQLLFVSISCVSRAFSLCFSFFILLHLPSSLSLSPFAHGPCRCLAIGYGGDGASLAGPASWVVALSFGGKGSGEHVWFGGPHGSASATLPGRVSPHRRVLPQSIPLFFLLFYCLFVYVCVFLLMLLFLFLFCFVYLFV